MKCIAVRLAVLTGALLSILGPVAPPAVAQDNGIFADFSTSLGSFTCRLEYTNAPKASASFIGLATGARPWLDTTTGQVRTNPFFNGLIFHRVIAKFMIQGGSPNGLGTDGPGYVIPDEFTPLLRFDGPGVLAMANSGPNSSGSQFFVTVTNTPWLNDVHTVFGRVTAGMSVVYAISQVATNDSSRPLTDVIIQSVSIRRVGTAAQAFDIQVQNLPVVSKTPLRIAGGAGGATLTFSNNLYAVTFLCSSSTLNTWDTVPLGVDVVPPATNSVALDTAAPAQFYSLSRVQYPASTFAPRTLYNRTLLLAFNGIGTVTIAFNAAGSGTYTFGASAGTVFGYNWTQDIYRGRLPPIIFSGLNPMVLNLNFNSDGGGAFTGTIYPSYPYSTNAFNVTGSFTLSAPRSP